MDSVKFIIGKNLPHHIPAESGQGALFPIHGEGASEAGMRDFVFRSPAMHSIYAIATQVAGSDASVLIYGESGTGKELFARLLHTLSDRGTHPFVPVNCGVLQGELFADKFFGHEAGAFTGASRQRKGAFELAGTGTLFLDEVGEIPASNQVDFLRVLEEKTFRRLGGEKDLPFQARIVAATNRSLNQMVREGAFRADLFYRLNVVPVCLPPLRSRQEDIPLLAAHTFSLFRHRYHKHDLALADEVIEAFTRYSWPGNVRELRNLMERLVLLARSGEITADDLPLEMRFAPSGKNREGARDHEAEDGPHEDFLLDTALRDAEARAVIRALKHTGGHKGRAAEILGISPRSLRYKVAEYGIR